VIDLPTFLQVNGGVTVANEDGKIRTIARWKSGLLPFEVFAMRVNCDTQRTSPCMSLTFAFHMSPEGLGNTFRDNLDEPAVSSASRGITVAWMK
jgi:hypothetical protein